MAGGPRVRPAVLKLTVGAGVVGPFLAVAVWGALGAVVSTTVWEREVLAAPGWHFPVTFEAGAVYRLELATSCFAGTDYAVAVLVWNETTGETLYAEAGSMGFTRGACRSLFISDEFSAPRAGHYTVEWNASPEVMAHGPRLRVVAHAMAFFDGFDLVAFGGVGAVWASAIAVNLYAWLRKRPPKGRSPVRVALPRLAPST